MLKLLSIALLSCLLSSAAISADADDSETIDNAQFYAQIFVGAETQGAVLLLSENTTNIVLECVSGAYCTSQRHCGPDGQCDLGSNKCRCF